MDCSLPGFSIHGIFKARVLEWGAIAFSKSGLKTPIQCQFSLELARCSNSISHSNKLYFPLILSPVWKFFPNPGTEPRSAALQTDSLPSEPLCLVAQSCPTLCDPVNCSLPGFSIHGIFKARVLEWGAIAFSIQSLIN